MLTEQQQAELLSGFGPWVAKQPAGRAYEYDDPRHCAFAQYLRAMGGRNVSVAMSFYSYNGRDYTLPFDINRAVRDGARTFGALAERLEITGWLNRAPREDDGKAVHLSPDTLTAGML